ncbi:hypothetical protein PCE1_003305 [Barthelona sp. PCE]
MSFLQECDYRGLLHTEDYSNPTSAVDMLKYFYNSTFASKTDDEMHYDNITELFLNKQQLPPNLSSNHLREWGLNPYNIGKRMAAVMYSIPEIPCIDSVVCFRMRQFLIDVFPYIDRISGKMTSLGDEKKCFVNDASGVLEECFQDTLRRYIKEIPIIIHFFSKGRHFYHERLVYNAQMIVGVFSFFAYVKQNAMLVNLIRETFKIDTTPIAEATFDEQMHIIQNSFAEQTGVVVNFDQNNWLSSLATFYGHQEGENRSVNVMGMCMDILRFTDCSDALIIQRFGCIVNTIVPTYSLGDMVRSRLSTVSNRLSKVLDSVKNGK